MSCVIWQIIYDSVIFWNSSHSYYHEFGPQIRPCSIILGPKYFASKNPGWLTLSIKMSVHFTQIWFLKVGISDCHMEYIQHKNFSTKESVRVLMECHKLKHINDILIWCHKDEDHDPHLIRYWENLIILVWQLI